MDLYNEIEKLLKSMKIPKARRKNISDAATETMTIGLVHKQFTTEKGWSKATHENIDLFNLLNKLADSINPDHLFSTITINRNVKCKPHKDLKNNGTTMIVGLGDYTGGELVINGTKHDIHYKPLYFNGFLHEHYNEDWTGDRYSLMYYSYKGAWDIKHRPEDVPIIKEVLHGNAYHNSKLSFGIEKDEHWVDIGAHIGCFSLKCLKNGATVTAYEPMPSSFEYLKANIGVKNCINSAVSHVNKTGFMKHGTRAYFNRLADEDTDADVPKTLMHEIQIVNFQDVIAPGDCVKMDIEGAEMSILDNCDFTKLKKMVVAYHVNFDKSRENLDRRVDRLRTMFKTVWHPPVTTMNFFPNELFIYCTNA
jgi:FkbM family methyltransferase